MSCIQENRGIPLPHKIAYCELSKDDDFESGFLIHKIIYESGDYDYYKWDEIRGYDSKHTVMHRTSGPAWKDRNGERWSYNGDTINCYNLQKDGKTIIGENTDTVGIVLKIIKENIHEALIGNKKVIVAIKKV